jgi:hypothetical protein
MVLYGFGCVAQLFVYLTEHVEGFGVFYLLRFLILLNLYILFIL